MKISGSQSTLTYETRGEREVLDLRAASDGGAYAARSIESITACGSSTMANQAAGYR